MSLPNLENYRDNEPTKSCYLDGRYFNLVFNDYPGLIENPLMINIVSNITKMGSSTQMKSQGHSQGDFNNEFVSQIKVQSGARMESSVMNTQYDNIIRVVIETTVIEKQLSNVEQSSSKHCNLLIVSHRDSRIYWFQPSTNKNGKNNYYVYQQKVQKILIKYLSSFLPGYLIVPVDSNVDDEKTPGCAMSGFCVAYCIKYGYDVINGYEPDLSDIRRFASEIENLYYPLDPVNPDIEYGFFGNNDNTNENVLLGGLGGAAVGTLLTGSVGGALAGGLVGGTAGYLFSDKNRR